MASKPKLTVVEPKDPASTKERLIALGKGTIIAAIGILLGKYVPADAITAISKALGF